MKAAFMKLRIARHQTGGGNLGSPRETRAEPLQTQKSMAPRYNNAWSAWSSKSLLSGRRSLIRVPITGGTEEGQE